MSVFADVAKAFVNSIRRVVHGYEEGRVIFDHYIENTLKAYTCARRTSKIELVKYDINDETYIKHIPLKVLLSHIETKSQLTKHLGEALLKSFEGSEFVLVVVYGTRIYSNQTGAFGDAITSHSHEEADKLLLQHVIDAFDQLPHSSVDVRSPDTDVFILVMDFCARNKGYRTHTFHHRTREVS